MLKILFATDFHGAEVCFRKLFNLAPRAKADVIVIGGDLCGKGLVPLVERNGSFHGEFLGTPFDVAPGEPTEEIEKRIRFNGFYPYRSTPDEIDRLRSDPAYLEAVMNGELAGTVERWMTLADEKLAGTDTICVSIPGNDDELAIDEALNGASRVRNCDGRLLDFGEFQIMGFGASNPTRGTARASSPRRRSSGACRRPSTRSTATARCWPTSTCRLTARRSTTPRWSTTSSGRSSRAATPSRGPSAPTPCAPSSRATSRWPRSTATSTRRAARRASAGRSRSTPAATTPPGRSRP